MNAEVISIGDELTSGQRLDTNSQWLSERLGELGIRVMYHTTVADDLEANVRVFRQAIERAEVIIVTGGLGPTADDLTRQALAETIGVELVLDEPSLEHIRGKFAHRKREMPPTNRVQALFPRGSQVIPNPHGTAPGIDLEVPRPGRSAARIFALPGVPAEMREMWQGTVVAALDSMAGSNRRIIHHRRIKCFGVGESDLEQMLPDIIRRGREPQVGITVSQATITLRISAAGENEAACLAAMEPTIATIHQCLGDLVYGEEDDELHHVVIRQLAALGDSLATVEWGTRGLLAYWLGESSRETFVSESCYRGGMMIHSMAALSMFMGEVESLTVSEKFSAGFVERMATACRERFATSYGLAIGPFPESTQTVGQRGEVIVAMADENGVKSQAFSFAGHPEILSPRTAKQALNLLRLALIPRGTV